MGRENTIVYMIVFLFLVFNSHTIFAKKLIEEVYLKDGSKIICDIIEYAPNNYIKLRTKDGSEFVYQYDQIEKIVKNDVAITKNQLLDMDYWEVGANLGIPSLLNLSIGRWFGPVGIRASGNVLKEYLGVQFNMSLKIAQNEKRMHALAGVVGIFDYSNNQYGQYSGIVYELRTKHFFFQTGVTLTLCCDYSNENEWLIQIGYILPFGKQY